MFDRGTKENVVEVPSRYSAGLPGEIEGVSGSGTNYPTGSDSPRSRFIDLVEQANRVEYRQCIVGEKLAAQLVTGKLVLLD